VAADWSAEENAQRSHIGPEIVLALKKAKKFMASLHGETAAVALWAGLDENSGKQK
jgi:hypothetical protein